MVEFKRNEKTGIVEAWKNGKKVGDIITMGDDIDKEEKNKDEKKKGNKQ